MQGDNREDNLVYGTFAGPWYENIFPLLAFYAYSDAKRFISPEEFRQSIKEEEKK